MTFYCICICNFYSRLLIPLHNAAIKSFGTHTHMHTHTHCSPPTPLSHHFPPLSHTCAIVSLSSDMQCLSITWRRRLDCPFTKEKTNLILILLDKKIHISLLLFRLRRTLKKNWTYFWRQYCCMQWFQLPRSDVISTLSQQRSVTHQKAALWLLSSFFCCHY